MSKAMYNDETSIPVTYALRNDSTKQFSLAAKKRESSLRFFKESIAKRIVEYTHETWLSENQVTESAVRKYSRR